MYPSRFPVGQLLISKAKSLLLPEILRSVDLFSNMKVTLLRNSPLLPHERLPALNEKTGIFAPHFGLLMQNTLIILFLIIAPFTFYIYQGPPLRFTIFLFLAFSNPKPQLHESFPRL